MSDPRETCLNRKAHTKVPKGYLQWYEWAAAKRKTHRQTRCEGCDRWVIWVKIE